MVATPVPTPVPEGLAACRALVAEGRWMAAYERVMAELKRSPNDPSLEEVRAQIMDVEPDAASLYQAMADDDYRAALGITKDLMERYPDETDLETFYDRSLFNAGLAELRAFNLSEAEVFLAELLERQPDDEEVPRMLEFINLYKARPVDMQLEIFVGSINLR
jgi:outer membrane protein assembly factor BamD (BamD/ComL family)